MRQIFSLCIVLLEFCGKPEVTLKNLSAVCLLSVSLKPGKVQLSPVYQPDHRTQLWISLEEWRTLITCLCLSWRTDDEITKWEVEKVFPQNTSENNKEASSEMISWFISSFSNVMWSLLALWNCVNSFMTFYDLLWYLLTSCWKFCRKTDFSFKGYIHPQPPRGSNGEKKS